jgi:hypothetical protein
MLCKNLCQYWPRNRTALGRFIIRIIVNLIPFFLIHLTLQHVIILTSTSIHWEKELRNVEAVRGRTGRRNQRFTSNLRSNRRGSTGNNRRSITCLLACIRRSSRNGNRHARTIRIIKRAVDEDSKAESIIMQPQHETRLLVIEGSHVDNQSANLDPKPSSYPPQLCNLHILSLNYQLDIQQDPMDIIGCEDECIQQGKQCDNCDMSSKH